MTILLHGHKATLHNDNTWACDAYLIKELLDLFALAFPYSGYFPGGPQVELVRATVKKFGAVALDLPAIESQPDVVY
jgi:hypothetical protein